MGGGGEGVTCYPFDSRIIRKKSPKNKNRSPDSLRYVSSRIYAIPPGNFSFYDFSPSVSAVTSYFIDKNVRVLKIVHCLFFLSVFR